MTAAPPGGPPGGIEVEWQFDAPDLTRVEAWLRALGTQSATPERGSRNGHVSVRARPKPARDLVDSYLDTADWRMARAGLVLRTRRLAGAVEVTVKDRRPPSEDGLRQRLEVSEPLPSGEVEHLRSDGPVGWRVRAVAGRLPLVPLVQLRTRRRPFALVDAADGRELGELTLDETSVLGPGTRHEMRLSRVEVEVPPECLSTLAPIVDDLRARTGVVPASLSKLEAGLQAVGQAQPGPPRLGPCEVDRDSTAAELAFAAVRRYVGAMLEHEPGTRLGEDAEELHDMRVATRRLRAAIGLFEEVLPPRAQHLGRELRWIARALGAVRDLDVQLERLPELTGWVASWYPATRGARLGLVRAALEAERSEARRLLLSDLDSPRWERLSAALVDFARQGPGSSERGRTPATTVVPELVRSRHHAAVKAARRACRTGTPADFHKLRIRCKRLRYSLDLTGELYGTKATRFVRKLAGLQDVLGRAQDGEVAAGHLLRLAVAGAVPGTEGTARSGRTLPASTIFVMGALAAHHRQDALEHRASLGTPLRVLRGKAWRKLSRAMDQATERATERRSGTRPGEPASEG